jgi:putative membrane-bound dehydrogenase-like protein
MSSISNLTCGFLLAISTAVAAAEFPAPTNNQPATNVALTPPAEALKMLHLPPGFKATLFAAEPDVQNPIAMCWDERGRLWIAENYTYSDSRERFDLKLRDRIIILEDADNDGHFDKRTVFADDLQMLTSIERGQGGVYAMCPPHLLLIPMKNDKPSGPPQIVLDGFSATASSRHTFANGLKWGPDGWLYGRVGITSTSWIDVPGTPQEQRKPTAGGIWRYHPIKKIYQPYCHGTTNPWGMDWDENGEMFFINTVIGHFWHGIQGAHYKRMHGDDPYQYIYDVIDQHADHYHWDTGKKWNETRDGKGLTDTLGGGHAHVGMMIYQGTNFPAKYRGKVFMNNMHGHRVNVDRIERKGSGYVGKHEPDFLKMDDPWFRATEIQYGPDGGVYILDWSDVGECHEDDGVHRTSGRIYKITYGDPVKPAETDVTKLSDEALVKLQLSDNEWLARMGRWELRERVASKRMSQMGLWALNQSRLEAKSKGKGLNMVWATAWLQELDTKTIDLSQPDAGPDDSEYYKNGMMRHNFLNGSADVLKKNFADGTTNAKGAQSVTQSEPSQLIRLTWASLLQSLPTEACLNAASGLLSHPEDAKDHNLPLMYWYGIRHLPPAELVKLVKDCRVPLVNQYIARRITEEIEKEPAALNSLLGIAGEMKDEALAASILQGMTEALKGWRKVTKPAAWDAFSALLAKREGPAAQQLQDLSILFGDGRAMEEVQRLALDNNAPLESRRTALRTLIKANVPDLRRVCETVLNTNSLSVDAIQGFATFDDPALAEKIVGRYQGLYPNERPQAIATLATRPSFAKVLLKHVQSGKIPRADITPVTARQIRSLKDDALTKELANVWGEVRESPEDKLKLMAGLKSKLTPDFIKQGKPDQGRVLYTNLCATCHKLYGEGSLIGPDLTGSGRHEITYLIENMADPSAVVSADYSLSIVTMKDGRVLSGIISGKNDRTLTVKMVGSEATVERSEIAKQEQLPTSMMPEGLLTALNDQQLSDLISYLMSKGQVDLPR